MFSTFVKFFALVGNRGQYSSMAEIAGARKGSVDGLCLPDQLWTFGSLSQWPRLSIDSKLLVPQFPPGLHPSFLPQAGRPRLPSRGGRLVRQRRRVASVLHRCDELAGGRTDNIKQRCQASGNSSRYVIEELLVSNVQNQHLNAGEARKSPWRDPAVRIFLVAVVVGATAVLARIWTLSNESYPKDYAAEKFDRSTWLRKYKDEGDNPAGCVSYARMAGDIVKNVVRPGMAYAEVEFLLFDVTVSADTSGRSETSAPPAIGIPLGLCELGKADSGQYIDIKFDIEGKVISASIG